MSGEFLIPAAPGQTTLGSARSESGTLSVRGGSVGGSFLPSAKLHDMGLRARNCGVQASQISSRLWMAREVPVEMVIRQGTICRQWNELQTLLGGSRA